MQLLFNEPQLVLYPNQYLVPDPTLSWGEMVWWTKLNFLG